MNENNKLMYSTKFLNKFITRAINNIYADSTHAAAFVEDCKLHYITNIVHYGYQLPETKSPSSAVHGRKRKERFSIQRNQGTKGLRLRRLTGKGIFSLLTPYNNTKDERNDNLQRRF